MTTTTAARMADRLALAAAPAFALMAIASAAAGAPMALCTGGGPLPVDGMTAMYLLMSLFHLPPWLRRASRRGRAAA
jgi:hypothetical protein